MGDVNIPRNHYHDKLATVLAKHIEGDDDVVVRAPAAAAMLGISLAWIEAGGTTATARNSSASDPGPSAIALAICAPTSARGPPISAHLNICRASGRSGRRHDQEKERPAD